MSGCPIIVGDGTAAFIGQQTTNFTNYANGAYQIAIEATQDLGHFVIDTIPVSTQFNPDNQWWHYIRPKAPATPDIVFDPDAGLIPSPPSGSPLTLINFDSPPTFNDTPPVLPTRQEPGPLTAVAPGDPPPILPITVPDSPDIVVPDVPTLLAINLPTIPVINIPEFISSRPVIDFVPPADSFAFTPTEYTSALLTKVTGQVSFMLDGGTGLPAAVVQALRDRAYSAVDIQETRAIQQASEEMGSRGFPEPSGILNRKLAEIRQNNQNQRLSLSRDIYVNDEQIAIENLRFAVTNGIALESTQINAHVQLMQVMLDAAKTAVELSISLYNARVALFGAQLQLYQADAQVFRDVLQAELAKLEIYKAEIDAQKLIGEINTQSIQIYAERLKGIQTIVDIYKAQVDAAKANAEVQRDVMEAYRWQVQGYAERVRAYEFQWEAFSKEIDADTAQLRRYELSTNVFAERVKVWSEINTNKIDQQKSQVTLRELDLNTYRAQIERITEIIAAEKDRVGAEVAVYQGEIEKYRADASIEATAAESNASIFRLGLEQERTRVDTALKNAEIAINQLIKDAELAVEVKKVIATVGSQLSAAAFSAMSVHAGLNSSSSNSQSCSTSYSFAGSADQ